MTFAAGADGQLGLVAPFAVVVSWLRGKRCRDLKERRDRVAGRAARGGGPARKEAGPIAPSTAPHTRRARRVRRGSAPVCAEAHADAAEARGAGRARRGAGSPLLPGVTATAMPRALAETPNADCFTCNPASLGRPTALRLTSSGRAERARPDQIALASSSPWGPLSPSVMQWLLQSFNAGFDGVLVPRP